jgi:hypothetical protein
VLDAEKWRAGARADLGVEPGALLVMYSGTLAAWQLPEASVRLFSGLKTMRADARLCFLTPEAVLAAEIVQREHAENVIVRSAPAGDVARLLCAADYGLLLRQDDTVNRVSCPVKFGEYLACGVRPVMTPHIGDQSELAQSLRLGVVVGLASPSEAGKMLASDAGHAGAIDAAGRESRRAWARENISPEKAAARIAEFVDGVV